MAQDQQKDDPLKGITLSKYEIERRLGAGGMGVVYLARDTLLERQIALKVLPPEMATDEVAVQRFLREAQAAAHLHHQNIVEVYDTGAEQDLFFFAMEYVGGGSVGDELRDEGWIDENDALKITRQAALALDYAHQQGVIHRDIKPDNLLRNDKGEVKIADLGLAHWKPDESALSLTTTGTVVGTPYYISPEQISGEKTIDARADVYSLGVTLYHMLAGRPPFKEGSSPEIMAQHLTKPIPPIRQFNPAITDFSVALVEKMMAKEREQRFQNMKDVVAAIDEILKEPTEVEIIQKSRLRQFKLLGMAAAVTLFFAMGWILYSQTGFTRWLHPAKPADSRPQSLVLPAPPQPSAPDLKKRVETPPSTASKNSASSKERGETPVAAETDRETLAKAATKGDLQKIQSLLAKGANPDETDTGGYTPLMRAVAAGHLAVVRTLLEKKASPDVKNANGDTALFLTLHANNPEMLSILLKSGANPGLRHSNGFTPLLLAAAKGHVECARLLLEAGANPNEKSLGLQSSGATSLMLASKRAMAKLLLDKGADFHERNSNGHDCLTLAAGYDRAEVVREILDHGAKPDDAAADGGTPLLMAAANNALNAASVLLEAGADPNTRMSPGAPMLNRIIHSGEGRNAAAVRLLVEKGADIEARGSDGFTPMMVASWEGYGEVAAVLKKAGAGMDLFCAAGAGDLDMVDGCLKRDENPNQKFSHGRTALMAAAKNGHSEVVDLLLARGADIRPRDQQGKTALDLAQENSRQATVEILRRATQR
ncbi:MAG: ankyrin repeat domain-containing protein [Verrucomicrobiae bacterium]|nr:ankyrin repeat domain-containing protein [Verrucomicrobiae bacterium]